MQAIPQSFGSSPPAAVPESALRLLDAAVHDLAAGILVVSIEGGAPRISYANDAMQAMTGYLLSERSDMRLGDLPGFGAALLPVLETARARDGFAEQTVMVRHRATELQVQVQIRPANEEGAQAWLVRVEALGRGADRDVPAWRRLAACTSGSGLGHWHWDLIGGTAWYDGLATQWLSGGVPLSTAKSLHARVHEDDREALLSAVRRHLEQNTPLDLEFRLKDPHSLTWLRLRGRATRDGGALPVELAGTLEDVTDRRRLVCDLRASQDVLRSVFNSMPACIAVLNPGGEIIELNHAWTEFPSPAGLAGLRFGFGENYLDLCRSAQERCAAARKAAEGIEQVLAGATAEFVLDYRVTCPDGAEHALQMQVRPFPTARGTGALVTHLDATRVDRVHRAMRETDAFYRMVLNAIPLYVCYVNEQRELLHANRLAEEWLGQPIEVLRGRRLDELMDAEDYAALESRMDAVFRGRRVDFETHVDGAGGPQDCAVSYLPHVVNGQVVGFFSVGRDVTQEKRLEAELLQSQKMDAMGQLTGGIAHDFNNLLSVIMGNLQLVERSLGPAAPQSGHVQTALGAVKRGADLTRRLLSFSRPQARDARPLDANALIAGLEDLVMRTIGEGIELRLALEPDLWRVRIDSGELENALLNLAINARDAMSGGGRLEMATRNVGVGADGARAVRGLADGDYVEISVSDSGCGMPPETQRKAFEPFFTTKEAGKGTGLGLSIVYGFAVRAGGTALIDSAPGRGTTIRLYFPRHAAAAGTNVAAAATPGTRSPGCASPADTPRAEVSGEPVRRPASVVFTDLAQEQASHV